MPLTEYTVVEMKQIHKNLIDAEVLNTWFMYDIFDATHIQLDKNHHYTRPIKYDTMTTLSTPY